MSHVTRFSTSRKSNSLLTVDLVASNELQSSDRECLVLDLCSELLEQSSRELGVERLTFNTIGCCDKRSSHIYRDEREFGRIKPKSLG